jgi:hypothetical protein
MVKSKDQVYIIFTVAVIGSLLYFYFDPSFHEFFPSCPFHTFTGLYCPGCGSQRAFHALLNGDITLALGYNMLFVLFLPFMLYSAGVTVNNIFRKQKIRQQIFRSQSFTFATLAVVLLFWILRNIQLAPFAWLAP